VPDVEIRRQLLELIAVSPLLAFLPLVLLPIFAPLRARR